MYENQSLAETAVASQVFLSREALGEFIECVKGAAVMKDLSNAQSTMSENQPLAETAVVAS